MKNYVAYHVHTELSLLDSCTNFKLYVDKAKELGQSAICFTEHGNTYNWVEKKLYCAEQGVKYLHGVECYLTQALLVENDKSEMVKVRDNYHTILIAKNYAGLQELNTLIDISTREDHTYYKPRLSFDEFKKISSNIIKISACLASPLNKLRDESLIQYYDYLEIQPHVNSEDQKEYNKWLYQMSVIYAITLPPQDPRQKPIGILLSQHQHTNSDINSMNPTMPIFLKTRISSRICLTYLGSFLIMPFFSFS